MIDIAQKLKDVPKGYKLYSPIFGEIILHKINPHADYPIKAEVKYNNRDSSTHIFFTKEGLYYPYYDGECCLFPSKENRDWENWIYDPFIKGQIIFYNECGDWRLGVFIRRKGNMYIVSPTIGYYDETQSSKILSVHDYNHRFSTNISI